jgi:hypothetical protein
VLVIETEHKKEFTCQHQSMLLGLLLSYNALKEDDEQGDYWVVFVGERICMEVLRNLRILLTLCHTHVQKLVL